MPITSCSLPNGKPGFRWGSSGKCYASKKDAIKQGIAIEGPDKFKKIMQAEGSRIGWQTVKAALEEYHKEKAGEASTFKSIANYLSGGKSAEVDRGGDLSNSDSKDSGGNNEFNKKGSASTDWDLHSGPAPEDFTCPNDGETVYDPQKSPAEASVDWELHSGPAPEDFTKNEKGDVVYDPQKPPASASEDDYGKDGEDDGDGDEPDPSAKADLDTPTEKVGSHTVVPPYNKEASPETDPDKKVGDYDPPSRSDMTPSKSAKEDDDCDPEMTMSALAYEKSVSYISQEERDKVPDEDFAGGGKSFPIRNNKDVEHAAMLLHHAPNPSGVKRKIIEIAKRKGLNLPESWKKPDEKSLAYEQALSFFSKASKEEKEKLNAKLDFEENAVNSLANSGPGEQQ